MEKLSPPKSSRENQMKTLFKFDFSEHLGGELTIASDASVDLDNDTACGAWQLHATRDKTRRVSQPLEWQTHSYYYLHELETFHLDLKDVAE